MAIQLSVTLCRAKPDGTTGRCRINQSEARFDFPKILCHRHDGGIQLRPDDAKRFAYFILGLSFSLDANGLIVRPS